MSYTQLDELQPDFAIMAGNEIEAQQWIDEWLINNGVNIGIVGSFGQILDVWSGTKPVPPEFFRKRGLGWLLRIPLETPSRRKRYIKVLAAFGTMWLRDMLKDDRFIKPKVK
ncbi:MAG: WecB/TagA/CpsF family glycosyltransferase [Patescibacteria group bacterium]|nr:WecB/TagA/CpsF family glycosyltransferase [Patescibacteria group bacterium]